MASSSDATAGIRPWFFVFEDPLVSFSQWLRQTWEVPPDCSIDQFGIEWLISVAVFKNEITQWLQERNLAPELSMAKCIRQLRVVFPRLKTRRMGSTHENKKHYVIRRKSISNEPLSVAVRDDCVSLNVDKSYHSSTDVHQGPGAFQATQSRRDFVPPVDAFDNHTPSFTSDITRSESSSIQYVENNPSLEVLPAGQQIGTRYISVVVDGSHCRSKIHERFSSGTSTKVALSYGDPSEELMRNFLFHLKTRGWGVVPMNPKCLRVEVVQEALYCKDCPEEMFCGYAALASGAFATTDGSAVGWWLHFTTLARTIFSEVKDQVLSLNVAELLMH
jgi:hypothetical protein